MFKVNAVGQAIPAGSNLPVELDEATVVEGCGGELAGAVFDPIEGVYYRVLLPAGTYTAHAEITWAGTPHASRHMTLSAVDSNLLNETTGQQTVTSLDLGPFTIVDEPGWVAWSAGVGSGVSGQSITSASFLQINCGGTSWRFGPHPWGGSEGEWG